jgi:YkoY family integral membrane protein
MLAWEGFLGMLSDPTSWGIVLTLVLLEGLLSADNALVLAVMVRHLPPQQQKKALLYGIWGAFIFRLIAIAVGSLLVKIWWVKILGGLYLLWLVVKHFFLSQGHENGNKAAKGFWATVVAVEMMDIAFSLDSILAALGISEQLWVLYLGGILGIITMRFVAGIFITLIKQIPELENTAYILIVIIAAKMIAGALGFHMSNVVFFSLLAAMFAGTILVHFAKKPHINNGTGLPGKK